MSEEFQFLSRVASTDGCGYQGRDDGQGRDTDDTRDEDLLAAGVILSHCMRGEEGMD